MSRRLRLPMLVVVLLLVGTTEGPRVWPLLVQAFRNIDWARINAALYQVRLVVENWVARGAATFGWTPLAFAIAAGIAALVIVAALILFVRPPRRNARIARAAREPSRRQEVGRLARAGEAVAVIARETRLSQDAVRTLIAAG